MADISRVRQHLRALLGLGIHPNRRHGSLEGETGGFGVGRRGDMGRRRGLELWRRNTIRTITMLSHAEGLLGSDARMPLSRGSVYGSTLEGGGRLRCHWGGLSGARARGPGLESQLCLHIDSYGRSVSHVWDKDRPEGAYQEGGLQACSWVCERGETNLFRARYVRARSSCSAASSIHQRRYDDSAGGSAGSLHCA